MAGITTREREDKQRIEDIKLRLKEPMSIYYFSRLQGTLSGLQDKQDRRIAERKAKLEADRKAAKPMQTWCVLPDNGRGPRPDASVAPSAAPGDDGWPDLSYQGKGS
jgi:hypothetical protein